MFFQKLIQIGYLIDYFYRELSLERVITIILNVRELENRNGLPSGYFNML